MTFRRSIVISALIVAALTITPHASAADVTLKLCTARKDGLYYFAGERIAAAAKGSGVAVEVVETAGSLFNMSAVKARLCDAAIAQADAVLRFEQIYGEGNLKLADPVPLHREFVYLVCRRSADLSRIGDLARRGAKARVLIGEPGSGSTVTWTALGEIDANYAKVAKRMVGRTLALTTIEDDKADCLVYVAGLGTGFMASIDAAGAELRLVDVDDETFGKSEVLGVTTYRFDSIPAGTYANLQAEAEPTKTISVQALVVIASRWSDRHPDAYAAFLAAVDRARPEILERAGQAELR